MVQELGVLIHPLHPLFFFTLIPHDFGMKKPPPLDSEEIIKVKTLMVDNLLEIEVAYSLLAKPQPQP